MDPTTHVSPHFRWSEAQDHRGVEVPYELWPNVHRMAAVLEAIRAEVGAPIVVNSWYRAPDHPYEKGKAEPGEHTTGLAVDIRCSHAHAGRVLAAAVGLGIKRLGIKQHGRISGRFIHVGIDPDRPQVPWSYA